MGKDSNISWCDHTFNIVWGCVKCGLGCQECYSERLARRWGYDVWGPNKPRRLLSGNYWRQPLAWNRDAQKKGIRQRVFCGSMCDVFEIHPDPQWAEVLDGEREKLWTLIRQTPWLDWLLLTKRPRNMKELIPADWPFDNVWAGVSVETPDYTWRIDELLKINAVVRWVSLEPLLLAIDIDGYLPLLDWVVLGAESGPNRRPFRVEWAADILRQCQSAGVAFFGKQDSGLYPGKPLLVDGREWKEWPKI